MRQARGPWLYAEPRSNAGVLPEHPADCIGRRFIVSMAFEPGIPYLIDNGRPFHGAGDQNEFALGGNHQDMRGEVTPMIEACQIADVLRRGEHKKVESP